MVDVISILFPFIIIFCILLQFSKLIGINKTLNMGNCLYKVEEKILVWIAYVHYLVHKKKGFYESVNNLKNRFWLNFENRCKEHINIYWL